MSAVPIYEYVPWAMFKRAIDQDPNVPDDDTDALHHQMIQAGSARLNACTRRIWGPSVTTRTFDAPTTPRLFIGDVQSVTSVALNGTPLTGSEYRLLPLAGGDPQQISFRWIERLAGTVPFPWYRPWPLVDPMAYGNSLPIGTVAIAGTWGIGELDDDDFVIAPPELVQVNLMYAVKCWLRHQQKYQAGTAAGDFAGTKVILAPYPLLDRDMKDAVWHLRANPRIA